jgi:hypothetical protein
MAIGDRGMAMCDILQGMRLQWGAFWGFWYIAKQLLWLDRKM